MNRLEVDPRGLRLDTQQIASPQFPAEKYLSAHAVIGLDGGRRREVTWIINNLLEPEQGAVVIADDVFGTEKLSNERPYLIASTAAHPVDKQYTGMVLSTGTYDGHGVPLSDADLEWDATFTKPTVACPWALQQLKRRQITQRIGTLTPTVVRALLEEAQGYLLAPEPVSPETGGQRSPTAVPAGE